MRSAPALLVGASDEAPVVVLLDCLTSAEEARLLDWLAPEREEELVAGLRAALASARALIPAGGALEDDWRIPTARPHRKRSVAGDRLATLRLLIDALLRRSPAWDRTAEEIRIAKEVFG